MPQIPAAGAHVWESFLLLSRTRQSGMGFNPLTFSEMAALATLRGRVMPEWEIWALLALDAELSEQVEANARMSQLAGEDVSALPQLTAAALRGAYEDMNT